MPLAASLEPRQTPALPPGFAEFYAEHYDFLWRCAVRMGVATDDVDDIVQECFVVALRRFASFDPHGRARPSTWLFGILRNVNRNHRRTTRRRAARLELLARSVEHEASEGRGHPGAGEGANASLARRLLDEFLITLDDDKRAAFVLAEIEGLTGPELADALELNLNTANSRLRAARRAFGAHFEDSSAQQRVRAQVERSANERGPEAARRAGLPAIAALASANLPVSTTVVGALGTKWMLGGLGLLAAVTLATAAVVVGTSTSTEVERAAAPSQPAPAPRTTAGPPTSIEPSALPDQPIAVTALAVTATPRAPTRQPTALQRIAKARQALLDDQPERALAWVEGHTFAPELDGRRVALEVAALCRLDRQALAQARARAWQTEHPGDPIAAELREVCWTE